MHFDHPQILLDFFPKISFRNTIIRVSTSLDPDQARQFVGPDLVPNCLQQRNLPLAGKELISWTIFLLNDEEYFERHL